MGAHLSRLCVFWVALGLAFLSPVAVHEDSRYSKNQLIFWNIGQGDFITLVTPRGCWIFDVGGSLNIPLKNLVFLRENCPGRRLDLFVSHFDKDHIRNFGRLASHLMIGSAAFSHLTPHSAFGKKLLENLKFQNSHVLEVRSGFENQLGEFSVRCLWPPPVKPLGKAENDRSLVLLLEGRGKKVLLTGDLPGKLEHKFEIPQVDILKVAHHGSRTSSTARFLVKMKPKVCVVSVGAQNTYGHPNPETLRRLRDSNCSILRTDRLGNLIFEL